MSEITTLIAATVLLVALVGAIQFIVLAFRDPFRPAWLKRGGVENVTAVTVTTSISFAVGFEIVALLGAGVTAFAAIAIAPLIAIVSAVVLWKAFHCGERLERTDAGLSPWHLARPSVPGTSVGA